MVPDNLGEDSGEENVKVGTNEDQVFSSNNVQRKDLEEFDSNFPKSEVLGEPLLRRFTRERQQSTKYSPDEYITLTDQGGLKVMKQQ